MSKLQPQDYNNHKKITPMYHYVLVTISTIVLIASFVYVFVKKFTFLSLLLLGVSISTMILVALVRQFATKLQDRIIRQEENLSLSLIRRLATSATHQN